MSEAAGAFDAWGSSLLGGALGAIFVVIGVVLAQRLSDNRRTANERRVAAHKLLVQISDLRDAATTSAEKTSGGYKMFPLRNELLISYHALGSYPSYKIVSDFYDRVRELRSAVRSRHRANRPWTTEDVRRLDLHLEALYAYSEQVINALKDNLEDRTLRFAPPDLPPLPPNEV